MRVYLGPANSANFSYYIEKSLKTVGIKADFISFSNSLHQFDYGEVKVFRLINNPPFKIFGKNIFYFINQYFLKSIYFSYTLIRYEVFIFIKPMTFFKNNFDLKILKFFGKKIVTINAGCADRDLNFDNDPEYVCNTCKDIAKQRGNLCLNIEEKMARAAFFEKYSDYVLGFADNTSFIKDKTKVHRVAIGMPNIIINAENKEFFGKLRISHLPSNPLMKGTNIIEPILNKINNQYDVEIIIKKEKWSRDEIINELKMSHIMIDSLAGYTFGVLSLEAIQYGCVVLNAYPDWIAQYYTIPPVVKVTGSTLYKTLINLINDRNLLREYALRSQEAFNKYFTYKVAGEYYKKIFNL